MQHLPTVDGTGISFVYPTFLRVCCSQKILIHKTFESFAERGKCSMGWSFGFKNVVENQWQRYFF